MEEGRKRTINIKGDHHHGKYSIPLLLGLFVRTRANCFGLMQSNFGALPMIMRVAM